MHLLPNKHILHSAWPSQISNTKLSNITQQRKFNLVSIFDCPMSIFIMWIMICIYVFTWSITFVDKFYSVLFYSLYLVQLFLFDYIRQNTFWQCKSWLFQFLHIYRQHPSNWIHQIQEIAETLWTTTTPYLHINKSSLAELLPSFDHWEGGLLVHRKNEITIKF